ncbi:hypothetical protein AB835_08005 [Candidatus Endobugula sertula]|uniref:AAA domain-containing protein n=1 Tax=Candidatus Endobugula sertula TaxID=62101 RepID=A0A1D2QPN7_9GAMM|nr:hypothetical protein AB835_08005 [Candidatus Endobugula sertula]
MPRFPRVYSIVATKGGVGKTTTVVNVAGMIADIGQRALIVDGDPQKSATDYFEITELAPHGLIQVFKSASTDGCISKTAIPNLDIILNDDIKGDSGEIPTFLRKSMTHCMRLRFALEALKDQYDYIIMDSQGDQNVVQESIILASDSLIIPINPEVLATRVVMQETAELVKNKFHPKLGFPAFTGRSAPSVKILINKYISQTNSSKELTALLRQYFNSEFDDLVQVLDTIIPNKEFYRNQAVAMRTPVHRLNREAYFTMLSLVTEDLEPKLSGLEPQWEGKRIEKSATAAR